MSFDSSVYPYNTVVKINVTIGGKNWMGSGVLISPDEVLTASHLVYQEGVGFASNIQVKPAYDEGYAPYGNALGTYIHYNRVSVKGGITSKESQYDYAVIHLNRPFDGLDYMRVKTDFGGGLASVAGYPRYSAGGETMASSTQTVSVDPTHSLVKFSAPSTDDELVKGLSGGPVWVTGSDGLPYVVGVVSSTQAGTGYSAQVTPSALANIKRWADADDATTGPQLDGRAAAAVSLLGSHTQYTIADKNGSLSVQDSVANRDGSRITRNTNHIAFTDGYGRFDPTGNAGDVARLYKAAFGRTPDLDGLDHWTAKIDARTLGLNDVAASFIASAEFGTRYGALDDAGFVQRLYGNVLGRAGDSGGVRYWTDRLNGGVQRSQVLTGFSESAENKANTAATIGDRERGEAYRLYQAAFNRTPDAAGLNHWTTLLDQGRTPLQVAQDFAESAEFKQLYAGTGNAGYVDALYRNVLHRGGDAGGVQFWVGQLNSGASRGQVLLGFSDSFENRTGTAAATHDGWVFLSA